MIWPVEEFEVGGKNIPVTWFLVALPDCLIMLGTFAVLPAVGDEFGRRIFVTGSFFA